MNNLVSRNPVQRFKQGNSIRKMKTASGGGITIKTSKPKSGFTVGKYTRKAERLHGPLQWYDENGNPITKRTQFQYDGYNYSLNTNGTYSRGKTKSKVNIEGLGGNQKDAEFYGEINDEISKDKAKKSAQAYDSQLKRAKKISTPVNKDWNNEFANNFTNTLTQAQRQYLDSKGVNYTNASDVQRFLMDQLQTNLGGYKDDGKWGKNSIQAWKDFIANNIPENFDVTQEQKNMNIGTIPYVSKPVANFGYRTSNTYEDNDFSDRLKNIGIRSNADLTNFMYKTSGENYNWNGNDWARQFRSDVNQALGGDYSDANIRKVFNTQGNWGRGFLGRGDIGDFQTALQTNAGLWNGSYDRNLGNYVKNIDWSKFKLFKQGGQLISKDPIKRFKQKNFRLVAQ